MTERLVRYAGVLIATVAVACGLVVSAFWAPFRIGDVPVPLALVAEFAINFVAILYAYKLCASKMPLLIPALVWVALLIPLAGQRREGDLVLYNSWVSLGVVVAGALGMTFAVMRINLPDKRR